MLSTDHIYARRRGEVLTIQALGERSILARELVHEMLALLENMIGETRAQIESAFATIEATNQDEKLRDGIAKLIFDLLPFEATSFDAAELRRSLFSAAVEYRNAHAGHLDRKTVLDHVGTAFSIEGDATTLLYADQKQEQRLLSLGPFVNPQAVEHLLETYDTRQIQAALLRATTLRVRFAHPNPDTIRRVLRAIKFRRLLATAKHEANALTVELEGPYQLFGPTSKYGIDFASLLPALARISALELNADLRWGNGDVACRLQTQVPRWGFDESPTLPDTQLAPEANALLEKLQNKGHTAAMAELPLFVAGFGLWMPDIVLTHHGKKIYIEVLGHYARQGLFARLEAARASKHLVLYCASEKLRVREELANDFSATELIVYKTAISIDEVITRAEKLVGA